jgi:hypothetical protein
MAQTTPGSRCCQSVENQRINIEAGAIRAHALKIDAMTIAIDRTKSPAVPA